MVTPEGRVKILDFGLAKLTAPEKGEHLETVSRNLTKTDHIFGTVPYMSPEQATGEQLDFRTDQFAFGVMIYEMLSGKRPFDRATAPETMAAIIGVEAPPITDSIVVAPQPLTWIMERCLQKEPVQRYDSTRDLYKEVRSVRDHASQSIPSTTTVAVSRPHAPLLRWLPFVLLPVAIVAGLYFGKLFWQVGPPRLRQLTFRRGTVHVARVAPDNQTIYYTATWEGGTNGLFSTRLDSPESSPVQMPDVEDRMMGDMAISSTGKMAIRNNNILSEMSLAGGAPKQILDNVQFADWTPDREKSSSRSPN